MKKKTITEDLVKALKDDPELYYSWQANIAVAMQDAHRWSKDKKDIHAISNEGAKNFLNLLIRD